MMLIIYNMIIMPYNWYWFLPVDTVLDRKAWLLPEEDGTEIALAGGPGFRNGFLLIGFCFMPVLMKNSKGTAYK